MIFKRRCKKFGKKPAKKKRPKKKGLVGFPFFSAESGRKSVLFPGNGTGR